MELNKAIPVARFAIRQVNVARVSETFQTNAAIGGCRFQHTGTYKGRQDRIPGSDDVGKFDESKGRLDERTMTDSLIDKAKQVKDTVKDKAYDLKETVKDYAGMGKETVKNKAQEYKQDMKSTERDNITPTTRDPQEQPFGQVYEEKGKQYESKYEDSQGTNRMGAEGNLWEASQHRARESTADRPGFDRTTTDRSTLEKVGDMIKGATETVTEKVATGAKKLGLKK